MNGTIQEALENAGTKVLSRPGPDGGGLVSRTLTVDEVKDYEEETHLTGPRVPGEHRAYAGPYTDLEDERNAWTAAQEAGETSRTKDLLEDPDNPEAKPAVEEYQSE